MQFSILLTCLAVAASAIPQLQSKMESKLISMLFNNYSGSATSQSVTIVPPSSTPTTSGSVMMDQSHSAVCALMVNSSLPLKNK